MYLKETGINTRNWVDSGQDILLESPCEYRIEHPGSIGHGVRGGYDENTFQGLLNIKMRLNISVGCYDNFPKPAAYNFFQPESRVME